MNAINLLESIPYEAPEEVPAQEVEVVEEEVVKVEKETPKAESKSPEQKNCRTYSKTNT